MANGGYGNITILPVEVDNNQASHTSGSSDSSGGSSGMDMLSGFTQLGTKIHEDALESINYYEGKNEDEFRDRRNFNEGRRQFNTQAAQTNRGQNMDGISMLANMRDRAKAGSRQSNFRNDVSRALGGM